MNRQQQLYVFVNGYGVPKNARRGMPHDGNYGEYLSAVLAGLVRRGQHDFIRIDVYLCGGVTDGSLSEAAAMKAWFDAQANKPNQLHIHPLPSAVTMRGNLEAFYQVTKNPDAPVMLYIELTDWPRAWFLARRWFRRQRIIWRPIAFADDRLRLGWWLRQLLVRLPLEVLGWYLPGVDRLINQPLRRRAITQSRRQRQHSRSDE